MGKKGGKKNAADNAKRKAEKRFRKGQRQAVENMAFSTNPLKTLRQLGLRLRRVDPDGNCQVGGSAKPRFSVWTHPCPYLGATQFRAVADQLFGDPGRYVEIRKRTIDELERNAEVYSGFVTDDEKYADYVDRMKDEAEWGDMTTLMAMASSVSLRVIVHQNDPELPRYELIPPHGTVTRTIHLFFDPSGEHYDSVRRIDDRDDESLPLPIPWPGDGGSLRDDESVESLAGELDEASLSEGRGKKKAHPGRQRDDSLGGGRSKGSAKTKKQIRAELQTVSIEDARQAEFARTLAV